MASIINKDGLRPGDVTERIGSDAVPTIAQARALDPLFRTAPRDPQAAENFRRAQRPALERAVANPPAETAALIAHECRVDIRLAQRLLALEKQVADLVALFMPPQS